MVNPPTTFPHSDAFDDFEQQLAVDDEANGSDEDSNGSSLLLELGPDDFPSFFSERGGRLFHSHGASPYPLPVDTPEQERLNVLHHILRQVIGANYLGPVPGVLAPEPGRQIYALDLCTGTGKWVIDMAEEFPHVQFRGLDLVPIATRYPPENVQFEVHDVNTPLRWADGTFNFIHARSVSMALTDYPRTLREIARLLRPGGLFLSCEWGQQATLHPAVFPDVDPAVHAPATTNFFNVLTRALVERAIPPVTSFVPSYLAASGQFAQITQQTTFMPIGPWHDNRHMKKIGRAFRAAQRRYAASVKPLLMESIRDETVVDGIIGGFIQELSSLPGLVGTYFTVHATKI